MRPHKTHMFEPPDTTTPDEPNEAEEAYNAGYRRGWEEGVRGVLVDIGRAVEGCNGDLKAFALRVAELSSAWVDDLYPPKEGGCPSQSEKNKS